MIRHQETFRGLLRRFLIRRTCGCLVSLAFLISACDEPLHSLHPLSEPGQAPYDERLLGMWYERNPDVPLSLYIWPAEAPQTLGIIGIAVEEDTGEFGMSWLWIRATAHATQIDGSVYYNVKVIDGLADWQWPGYVFLQAELSVDGELTFSYMNESVLSRLGWEGRPLPSEVEPGDADAVADIRPMELVE